MTIASRRLVLFALPVLLLAGAPSYAGNTWAEPRFDPPVGSKWTVEREVNIQKNTGGTMIGHTLKQSALLTVEEKTADGYVMSYARSGSTYEGDPAGASAQRIAYAAAQGVVMRVATDAAGKPLRILNFAEVKTALKQALAELPLGSANPDYVAAVHRISDRMVAMDDKQAAELVLDDLPLLALGQNTGLQPGDTRKTTLPVANPLVGGMTKVLTLSIAKDDPETGKVRYLMTETFDPDSMKTLIGETAKELGVVNARLGDFDRVASTATVVAVARAQLDAEGGMTREMRRQAVTSFRASGALSVTTEDELVTVSPAE
jgi:hypothetical protein